MWEREKILIRDSDYFKALACAHFRKIRKNGSNSPDALDDAERMLASEDVRSDIVFFDMPGTFRSNCAVKTISPDGPNLHTYGQRTLCCGKSPTICSDVP